jgi:hypothetical protein
VRAIGEASRDGRPGSSQLESASPLDKQKQRYEGMPGLRERISALHHHPTSKKGRSWLGSETAKFLYAFFAGFALNSALQAVGWMPAPASSEQVEEIKKLTVKIDQQSDRIAELQSVQQAAISRIDSYVLDKRLSGARARYTLGYAILSFRAGSSEVHPLRQSAADPKAVRVDWQHSEVTELTEDVATIKLAQVIDPKQHTILQDVYFKCYRDAGEGALQFGSFQIVIEAMESISTGFICVIGFEPVR